MVRIGSYWGDGYTGLELIKMITNHPKFELKYLATSQGDITIEKLHPSLEGVLSSMVKKLIVKM